MSLVLMDEDADSSCQPSPLLSNPGFTSRFADALTVLSASKRAAFPSAPGPVEFPPQAVKIATPAKQAVSHFAVVRFAISAVPRFCPLKQHVNEQTLAGHCP